MTNCKDQRGQHGEASMGQTFAQKWWGITLIWCSFAWLSGCGTLPDGRRWGQDVTLFPGWERLGQAAVRAALDPGTWVPAAGALAFQIDSWDRNLAHWAANQQPLYGSRQCADDATDALVGALLGAYVITGLATPSGEEPAQWVWAKLKGFTVGAGAVGLTLLSTDGLKRATGRPRPDGSSNRSFPSSSTSLAGVYRSLASRNLDCLPLPGWGRLSLKTGMTTLMAATAWARLEGKFHYPSDVLVGMALGNFIGAFLNDAFIGPNDPNLWVTIQPTGKDLVLSLYWTY